MPLFSEEEIFIVTGASSGIGRAVAVKLISENASVIAIGRNEERLTKLRSEVLYPQNLYIEAVDLVSQLSDMPSFLRQLKEKYGKFSGIAYCAGAILLKPASETTYEESLDLFKINYFVPTMIGNIAFSLHQLLPFPTYTIYALEVFQRILDGIFALIYFALLFLNAFPYRIIITSQGKYTSD